MPIAEICSQTVIFVRRDETVKAAAELMHEHHVGSIVVVDERDDKRMPVGMLTDRDIVIAVVALGLDAATLQAGDVMSHAVWADAGAAETVELMRLKGVRRFPVVDAAGALFGIVAAADILALLAEEMSAVTGMLAREEKREANVRTSRV